MDMPISETAMESISKPSSQEALVAAFYTLALALAPSLVQHLVYRHENPTAKAQPMRAHRRHGLWCPSAAEKVMAKPSPTRSSGSLRIGELRSSIY
jgi:hypothetical protein